MDHEQNIKLQNFAKQSRETADLQKQIAQNASRDLRTSIDDAHSAFKQLEDVLIKYDVLDANKEAYEFSDFNYDSLKQTTTNLIAEATEQKTILDKSSQDMQDLIKKISNFKIPDEKEMDNLNQDTKNAINDINSKVILVYYLTHNSFVSSI